MGKINLTRVYHIGVPVNDLKKSERFYVDVLGMKVTRRGSGVRENNQPYRDILGYWPEVLRLSCADDEVEVVLFERPKPIFRDWKEDSICHTAFCASKEDFDLALEKMKEWGVNFHLGPIDRGNGRALYFFNPDGNYFQLDDRG